MQGKREMARWAELWVGGPDRFSLSFFSFIYFLFSFSKFRFSNFKFNFFVCCSNIPQIKYPIQM
jgi:hypothetical protein